MKYYKSVDMNPRFLPVVLEDYLMSGSFALLCRLNSCIAILSI